jgi:hypothetical protein
LSVITGLKKVLGAGQERRAGYVPSDIFYTFLCAADFLAAAV